MLVSRRRDATAARRCFKQAIGETKVPPVEVTTDQAPVDPAVVGELLPAVWHRTDRYANDIAGHGLVQNARRGHYELAAEEPATRRVAVEFDELAVTI